MYFHKRDTKWAVPARGRGPEVMNAGLSVAHGALQKPCPASTTPAGPGGQRTANARRTALSGVRLTENVRAGNIQRQRISGRGEFITECQRAGYPDWVKKEKEKTGNFQGGQGCSVSVILRGEDKVWLGVQPPGSQRILLTPDKLQRPCGQRVQE